MSGLVLGFTCKPASVIQTRQKGIQTGSLLGTTNPPKIRKRFAAKKISWTNWNYSDDFRSGAAWIQGTCPNGPWTASRLKPAGAWVRDRIRNPPDSF